MKSPDREIGPTVEQQSRLGLPRGQASRLASSTEQSSSWLNSLSRLDLQVKVIRRTCPLGWGTTSAAKRSPCANVLWYEPLQPIPRANGDRPPSPGEGSVHVQDLPQAEHPVGRIYPRTRGPLSCPFSWRRSLFQDDMRSNRLLVRPRLRISGC